MRQSTSSLKTVNTGVIINKTDRAKTSDCFKGSDIGYYDDKEIDKRLTKHTPETEGGVISCHKLSEGGHTFMDIAHELLLLKTRCNKACIARLLIEKGKTFSLKQLEDLRNRLVVSEVKAWFNKRYSNFFFVHDEKKRVIIVSMFWTDGFFKRKVWGMSGRMFHATTAKQDRLFSRESDKVSR